MARQEHRRIEPLLTALDGEGDGASRRAAARSGLLWKLVLAALVLAGLTAIVVNQAF